MALNFKLIYLYLAGCNPLELDTLCSSSAIVCTTDLKRRCGKQGFYRWITANPNLPFSVLIGIDLIERSEAKINYQACQRLD